MTFISFYFYIFLASILIVYYIIPIRARWFILLIGSLSFYWFISEYSLPCFVALILLSFISWFSSHLLNKIYRKKLVLAATIIISILPLFIIKSLQFLPANSSHSIFFTLIVPVGIAFFTLQLVAYEIDCYKGIIEPEKNFFKYLLFVSFFPQIIQGPIPRYKQLSPQLSKGHQFEEKTFVQGFILILWGFFLKLCIADKIGIFVDQVFNQNQTYQGFYVLAAGVFYSIQLYTDFLSCTTLAQGISLLFGIELSNNFARPYFAVSIKDFWRRWHISLSSWLKDYVYIPLGGNRKGVYKKHINILLTFLISGFWHGSGFKFLVWGFIHGLYQVLGDLLLPQKNFVNKKLHLDSHIYLKKLISIILTFIMVMFAWIIFRADTLEIALEMITSLFTVHNAWILVDDSIINMLGGWKEFNVLCIGLLLLLSVSICQENDINIKHRILYYPLPIRWIIYIGAILFIMIFGTYGYGFDARAFIYGGF